LKGEFEVAKTAITHTDLIWIFHQRLKSFNDGSSTMPIAIVPSDKGWTVLTSARYRRYPRVIKRIEQIQEQLRKTYVLIETGPAEELLTTAGYDNPRSGPKARENARRS
jgi:MinD-like ATPase involved in chromosome partitioning or flagellar assembly